jgi:hypothetical protein
VKKLMAMVAMLALMLVAAAPAFAQDVTIVNQQAAQFGVVDDSISSQVFNVAAQQYNAGNQSATANAFAAAGATAGPFGTAAAAAISSANAVNVANAAGVGIYTVNVSLNY